MYINIYFESYLSILQILKNNIKFTQLMAHQEINECPTAGQPAVCDHNCTLAASSRNDNNNNDHEHRNNTDVSHTNEQVIIGNRF